MKKLFKNYVILSAVIASVVLVVGCSGDPDSASAPASPEIKGEPIQKLTVASPVSEVGVEKPVNLPVAQSAEIEEEEAIAEVAGDDSVEVVADEVVAEATNANRSATELIQSGGRDYLSVGFDYLASYEFEVTDELLESEGDSAELTKKTNGMIPEEVRELNASSVAVKGYMLPLKVEEGQVTEFLLMRDQSMCCFGTVPKINEWVSVKTIGSGVKAIMDEPVTIFGKLHVGEIRENGYLVGIYRMDGEKLAGPLDL